MIHFISDQIRLFDTSITTTSLEHAINYFKDKPEIQVDSETTGLDCHVDKLWCIQLGDVNNQFVLEESAINYNYLRELLESKLLIFHNAKFDLKFLYGKKIFPKTVYDTFLAECILTTGYEKRELGLDALALKYAGITLDKSIRGNINKEGLTDRVIKYSADDVKCLSTIKEKQLVKLQRMDLLKTLDLECEVVKVFARMEYNGIRLNREKWNKIADITEAGTKTCEGQLDDIVVAEPKLKKYIPKFSQGNLFGEKERTLDINWGSPAQKLKILKTLGFETDTTGDRFLQKNKRKHPLINKIIEYNKNKKLADAFGREFLTFINEKTGRIHCNIWQILTTGRISVSKPNLNQIPSKGDLGKEIRSCFIPSKGCKIVGGDYAGMELRIIAEFSKDPLWIEAFRSGQDLHSVLAAATFGIPIEDVKKETPFKKGVVYRDVQKTVNFGLAYGMSKFKLADTIDIEVDEADEIIKKFFSIVPKVDNFLTLLGEFGKKNGYIRTSAPYKRIRLFPNHSQAVLKKDKKLLGEIERASKNSPIQGTNGDLIKLALCRVQEYIDTNKFPARILLSVYDEIQTECKEEVALEWKMTLDRIMVEAAQVVIKSIPVVVDCKIQDYWSK